MPINNSQKTNVAIFGHAKDKKYELDINGHSRGGLTISVSTQYALNNGMTLIPINKVRFYGTATHVQDYSNLLYEKNKYITKKGYNSSVYSAVHETDFVGRSPLVAFRSPFIVGGNDVTGGIGGWFKYSHSSYFAEIPQEFIFDKDGNKSDNQQYLDYEKMWGKPINGVNASLPILVRPTSDKKQKGKFNEKPF